MEYSAGAEHAVVGVLQRHVEGAVTVDVVVLVLIAPHVAAVAAVDVPSAGAIVGAEARLYGGARRLEVVTGGGRSVEAHRLVAAQADIDDGARVGGFIARRRVGDQLHALDALGLHGLEELLDGRSGQVGRLTVDVHDGRLTDDGDSAVGIDDDARQLAEYVGCVLARGQHVDFGADNHSVSLLQDGWGRGCDRHFAQPDARFGEGDRAEVRFGGAEVDGFAHRLKAD